MAEFVAMTHPTIFLIHNINSHMLHIRLQTPPADTSIVSPARVHFNIPTPNTSRNTPRRTIAHPILKHQGGGGILGLQAKKGGGGPEWGPTLGPMLKSLHPGKKGGGRAGPPPPPDPHGVPCIYDEDCVIPRVVQYAGGCPFYGHISLLC